MRYGLSACLESTWKGVGFSDCSSGILKSPYQHEYKLAGVGDFPDGYMLFLGII
jgi:hypothetical protein